MLRERRIGNNILDRALRVGSDEADAQVRRVIQRVWNADLAGLQAVLVNNVLLGGEDEPDGFVISGGFFVGVIIISNKSFLGRRFLFLHLLGFNVSQKRRRGFGDLQVV
jgi:hypothetical protein